MGDGKLTVVAYEPDRHAKSLFRFIEKVLGAEACVRRRRIIETMHASMPGCGRFPLRHIILDGDRVAGTLGYMPADFLVKGERVAARFTHDLLVDPDYRGAGLAKLIVGNALAQGDFFPGGMWMTDPCHKIHVACGFDEATPLTTYSLVLDPAAFVARRGGNALKSLALRAALGATRALARLRARRHAPGPSLGTVKRFDPALDGAWREMAAGYGVTRLRDAAYLNWKYADHGALPYCNLIAKRDGAPAGFLVWRPALAGENEKRAVVADFLVANGDAETFRALVGRVVSDAAGAGMESVSVVTTQPWAEQALRRLGFLPRSSRNTWVVAGWKPFMPPAWLSAIDAWHVCLGDSDGDMWTGSL